MRRKKLVFLLLPVLVSLACGSTDALEERQKRLTDTAVWEQFGQTLTAVAATANPQTATPECTERAYFGLGRCRYTPTPRPPRTPRPTRTAEPTPTIPVIIRIVEIQPRSGGQYTPYFSDPSKVPNYHPETDQALAQLLRKGFSLSVVAETEGGRFLKVIVFGWMNTENLDLEQFKGVQVLSDSLVVGSLEGRTACDIHDWDHDDACHGHFWDGDTEVGTVPRGTDFVFADFVYDPRRGFVVPLVEGKARVRILEPAWVRAADVKESQ